jgi:subtilase family serine protease
MQRKLMSEKRSLFRPVLEALEGRVMLSTFPGASSFVRLLAARAHLAGPASGASPSGGLSPSQVQHAYGFDQIAFNNGSVKGDGTGQTIAVIDCYDQPNIANDLAAFDAALGIAAPPSFTKVGENGGAPPSTTDQNWGLEISLDVEWAHGMAPGAKILLVEASSSNFADIFAALDYARNQPGVSVVTMSFGGAEWSGETSYDSHFSTPSGHNGVSFVASSGDSGAVEYPAISSNVLAVGGTTLTLDGSNNDVGETAWSGSGGGIGVYYSQPSYQKGVVTQSSTKRTSPDVAYDGDPGSGFGVYDSFGFGGWITVGGTSAGAPQWAALLAVANQGRALAGQVTLDGLSQTMPKIYALPQSDFHDVTSGSNGTYSAGAGYDPVTGRGTPLANLIVPALIDGSPSGGQAPTVATPASASPSLVTGISTNLSVLGAVTDGATLAYTWTVTSAPASAPTPGFSVNGTNAARNTTATFHAAGSYTFLVTITDPTNTLAATSSVTVTVAQTLTSVAMSPASVTLAALATKQFTAAELDQFGQTLSSQPTFVWSMSGMGTLSTTGMYTAPATIGTATVQASAAGMTCTAAVTVSAVPAAPAGLTATATSKQLYHPEIHGWD